MYIKHFFLFTLFLFLALTLPFGVSAQIPDTGALFIFKITPTHPSPGVSLLV